MQGVAATLFALSTLFVTAAGVPVADNATLVGDEAERICRWYGIGEGEYCCPHAKRCLRPVRGKTCEHSPCDSGQTCCPLTKLCVTVHARE